MVVLRYIQEVSNTYCICLAAAAKSTDVDHPTLITQKGDLIMVFEKLKEIFGRVMPQCDPSTITMDSVLTTDLGVDSLNMMLLAITVEDEFKIRFSSDAKLETVKDIVDYVEANAK